MTHRSPNATRMDEEVIERQERRSRYFSVPSVVFILFCFIEGGVLLCFLLLAVWYLVLFSFMGAQQQ